MRRARRRGADDQVNRPPSLGAESDTPLEDRQGWYEPLTDPDAISRAVRYVLATAQLFLDSPSAISQLPLFLAASEVEQAPDDRDLADDGASFDISPLFDGHDLERI